MEKITNFLLNPVKVPTQVIYGLIALAASAVYVTILLLCGILSEIWPLGALALVWYCWW